MKRKYRKFTKVYMKRLTHRHSPSDLNIKTDINLLNWGKKFFKRCHKSDVRCANKKRSN